MGSQSLVLFDFDGTLTNRNSLFEFLKFSKGLCVYYIGLAILLPLFILFFLGLINAQALKERVLSYFFKNYSEKKWIELCEIFAEKKIPSLLRKSGLEKLKIHQAENSKILVVSASFEDYLKPWTKKMGLECLATQIEVSECALTGKIKGVNCNGLEKVKRIKEFLSVETFSPIYAYGDSKGDLPMLALADFKFYNTF